MPEQCCGECHEVFQNYLRQWPLWSDSHRVDSHLFDDGKLWIGYRTHVSNLHIFGTAFDLNIINGVCYVLWIQVHPQFRGRGFGASLYSVIENAAREYGCHEIRMTPSGDTRTGDTRENYLLRRGYRMDGIEAVKSLYTDGTTCPCFEAKEMRDADGSDPD